MKLESPLQESERSQRKYTVRLDVFEGPLDLLLYLIKKEEVDIHDVALERIISQFLDYVNTFQELNIDLASEFVVMAANLMYIKSRTLLPQDEQLPDEAEEEDPRWELIRQLIEYKKFKQVAATLLEKSIQQQDYFGNVPGEEAEGENPAEPPVEEKGNEEPEAHIIELVSAFQSLLKRLEEEHQHQPQDLVDDQFTVAEKMQYLLDVIPPGKQVAFIELFERDSSKEEFIVTFLALLELLKLNRLTVQQEEVFGTIQIARIESQ